ncbi:MAG TPA: 3-phosphoshikimate 1-carboxyvinyltransferase [Desulfotomaculum sp.]|nr:MAG: 3-phosphoshikimate 1-carboxyvinyltransferase [Desulfotomaculum sp. BICA1-6]HBX24328.1 3-phosphoshikimate 1-carboxyvinyltransferase [Desulfotomaculum sp.]
MEVTILPTKELRGQVRVPGDKSISHRAVMLGALACGETEIDHFLFGADCLSTIEIIRALGVQVFTEKNRVVVRSGGMDALLEPENMLDAGNSGTTMRLMAGVLSGCPFFSVLTGDNSLRQRPMGRVIKPLTAMGARITARKGNSLAPLAIQGGKLQAMEYCSPVASAQVKSAVMLAGLFTAGVTTVIEPARSRDHTERMLKYFGARVEVDGQRVSIWGRPNLTGKKITIPGDISSAMFFIAAGITVPGAKLDILNVGINPTRTGALAILKDMGADITLHNRREVNGEPVADLKVRGSQLKGTVIGGEIIPKLIDEIPVLAVVAALAEGETVVRDAAELRHKESDRITAVVRLLGALGADVSESPDGFVVRGGRQLKGAPCDSFGDHRMAMAAAVAGLSAHGSTTINGAECVDVSFPDFFDTLNGIIVK